MYIGRVGNHIQNAIELDGIILGRGDHRDDVGSSLTGFALAMSWREKSPISTGRGNKITFLPRMDCFDYFDPRHGASRFPWSFKKLFLSSSFSVWEEDWGDIVR